MQNARKTPRGDIALIERIVARDQQAVGELYDRHHRLLFGLILRIIARSQRGGGDPAGSVRPGLDACRNLQRVARAAGGVAGAHRPQPRDRSAARQHRARCAPSSRRRCPSRSKARNRGPSISEQQRAVARALESLPPDQRLLIEQAYFLGLTQSELAERFKLPLGTVKTRIRTGMLALREQLSQVFIEQ